MAHWGGGYPASFVIEEQDYQVPFECRLKSSGAISLTQTCGRTRQEIAGERLRRLDRWYIEQWGGPFTGYSDPELGVFARLPDCDWVET